jgi:hypothetical protein
MTRARIASLLYAALAAAVIAFFAWEIFRASRSDVIGNRAPAPAVKARP